MFGFWYLGQVKFKFHLWQYNYESRYLIIIYIFSYSLTLIDSLDMIIILGNRTEFERVVDLLVKNLNFDKDINVSVFETNIRGSLIFIYKYKYSI